MSLLTDIDIRKILNEDIIIEPFNEGSLTPIGYDFSVGDFIFSLQRRLLQSQGGKYEIQPKETIQVLTAEALWVSGRIAGTFHSKVSLVSKGFSHISTTLDPLWKGRLLITFTNNSDRILTLGQGDKFVTLLFYFVHSPTRTPHYKPGSRTDQLTQNLEQFKEGVIEDLAAQTSNYISKVAEIFDQESASDFSEKVKNTDKLLDTRILEKEIENREREIQRLEEEKRLHEEEERQKREKQRLENKEKEEARLRKQGDLLRQRWTYGLYFGALLSITLGAYWKFIKVVFGNIDYDSQVIGSQLGIFGAFVLAIIGLKMEKRR